MPNVYVLGFEFYFAYLREELNVMGHDGESPAIKERCE